MIRNALVAFTLVALTLAGCKKDDSGPLGAGTTGNEDDAADVIAASLGGNSSTNGLTSQFTSLANLLGGVATDGPAGGTSTLADTTITLRFQRSVPPYSYDYTFTFTYGFIDPNSFSYRYTMKGIYDIPRMSSDDSAHAAWTVGDITSGAAFSVNGAYTRLGSQVFKLRNNFQWTTQIVFTLNSVLIDKTSRVAVGGTASLTVSGQNSNGGSFSYSATVTFGGGSTAGLVVNGKSYIVDLALGEIRR